MIVRTVLSNSGSINSFRWRIIILRSRSTALLPTSAKRLTSRDGLPGDFGRESRGWDARRFMSGLVIEMR